MALPLVLYIALAGLSMLVAPDGTLAFFEMFLLLQTFLLFLYVVNTTKTREDVLFVVTMLLTGLVLESLIIIGLRFLGHSVRVAGILARVDPGPRVGGTVGSPNNAAAFLVMPLVCAGRLADATGRFTRCWPPLLWARASSRWSSRSPGRVALVRPRRYAAAAWYRGWLSRKAIIGIVVVLVLRAGSFAHNSGTVDRR